jgi:NADPH:quinone reductase-like Zn-dependent oxidoreductase
MVEIESKVFGLNFRDVMTVMGLLKQTGSAAHENSGIIKRLGPGAGQSGFQIGDRVCGVFQGHFATTSRALWTSVTKILDETSWEEAVSIPYAYGTAYIRLFNIARLNKGERVLIHSATGGVGQAALMLAQHIRAETFVTCGLESKRRLLIDRCNVPPDHIFSSRDTSFTPAIMAQSGG